jgi:acyl-CoA thioesterase-1
LLACLLVTCSAAASERTLLVFGDSLSAAYGLRTDQGWVTLLQQRLQAQGYGYRVVNASVSGETTEGGRNRLARALMQQQPQLVILELGGNDGLRGLPVKDIRANMALMIEAIRRSGAKQLLVGVQIPPNYGPQYAGAFAGIYQKLAKEQNVPVVPFLLEGVALDKQLMQADGIHANAQGQPRLLENVWIHLQPLLRR